MKTILSTILFLVTVNIVYAQLSPPTLIAPPNNDTNVSVQPTFDWSDVPGATSYRIQIYTGLELIIDQSNLTGSTFTISSGSLAGYTWYYWRAAAVNASQTSWSGYWYFRTTLAAPLAPVLVSPLNGATGVSRTPILDWNDVTGALYYSLQVSINPSFSTTVINISGLTSSQFVVSNPLNYSTTYYWRVNASNIGGTSPWSSVWNFTTLIAPPAAPTLVSPPNGAIGVTLIPLIDWNNVSGTSITYRLQMSTDPNFNNTLIDATNLNNSQFQIQPGMLSGSTQYYWRVAASNQGGQGPWSVVWNFTTQIGPPAAPLLAYPINGQIHVSRLPLMDWGDVSGAGSYRIQIATESQFVNPVINTLSGNSQYQLTVPLAYNTQYYWRVNAINNGGAGPWSEVWNFTTIPEAPAPPMLIAPLNNSNGISLTPALDWTDVNTASSYIVQIGLSSTFNNIVYNDTVVTSGVTVPAGILNGSITYYWRVYARNEGGLSSPSVTWSFTTLVTLNANLKLYLEGFYNGSTQIRDTIRIYLANQNSPYAIVDSTIGVMSNNGTLLTSFTHAAGGSYYLVIKHRNHLETWSSTPLPISYGNPLNYDFTTASTKAYGNNMKQVGSVWVFYGGDASQDGFVDNSDYLMYVPQFGRDGYKIPDFNGDSYVDGWDLLIFYSNIGKSKARP